MNHNAIYRAYPQVIKIDDSIGALDAEGNLVELDDAKIEKAAKELIAEQDAKLAEAETKRQAALSKLAELGLTTEDLKALGL